MSMLTVAVCTYNRADRLPAIVRNLRRQSCRIKFDLLFIDNNSNDNTRRVLSSLAAEPGATLRYVSEKRQGITHARNRAIEECLQSDYMIFIDDDELPQSGFLAAAIHALETECADCVGGRVKVGFPNGHRPNWLSDELLGFLAGVDYGDWAFWIKNQSTPVWTANIGYRMHLFRSDPSLRFDERYNREGNEVGGGEDAIMFRDLLERNCRIRYRPDMVVEHYVERWRLNRRYFLQLHFVAGEKYAMYETQEYERTLWGVPPFMLRQALEQCGKTVFMYLLRSPRRLRQGMNGAYAVGCIKGRFKRWKTTRQKQLVL